MLRFAPKPHIRHSSRDQLPSSEADKSVDDTATAVACTRGEEDVSSDECSMHTCEDQQSFDQSSFTTGSEEDAGTEVAEQESTQHTGNGDSAIKADEISGISASAGDAVQAITKNINTLPLEKLKLLKKLIKKNMISKQCKVMVDTEYKTVTLTGTNDNIETTELAIYEAVVGASERLSLIHI